MKNPGHHVSSSMQFRDIGDGPPVLFIHGWMVSSRVWDRLLPRLAGYRLILPDLRGSGTTPAEGEAVTLADYLADLAAFCAELALHGAHLVGHSMGGQLAALLAARHPERFATLTLMNPVPIQGLDFPAEMQPLFRNCGGDRNGITRIVNMSCLQADEAGRSLLVEDGMKTSPAVISTGFEAFRRGDANASLDAARMPTTVIATDDPFLPPAFLQAAVVERFPNARLEYLRGAGHYPQVEVPEDSADLLGRLLA